VVRLAEERMANLTKQSPSDTFGGRYIKVINTARSL
jgi:hypothetical protein